jgi:hypothetical protein
MSHFLLGISQPPPARDVDALIDANLSSDINRSLSEDDFVSNIPIEEAVDPKEVLEEMERLTGDERTSQSPDAETDRTPGMEREQEVWYLIGRVLGTEAVSMP